MFLAGNNEWNAWYKFRLTLPLFCISLMQPNNQTPSKDLTTQIPLQKTPSIPRKKSIPFPNIMERISVCTIPLVVFMTIVWLMSCRAQSRREGGRGLWSRVQSFVKVILTYRSFALGRFNRSPGFRLIFNVGCQLASACQPFGGVFSSIPFSSMSAYVKW